jgi:hypothetical protein
MNVWDCSYWCSSEAYVLLFEDSALTNIWSPYIQTGGYFDNDIPSDIFLNSGSYTLVYGNYNNMNGNMSIYEGMGVNEAVSQFSVNENYNENFTIEMSFLQYDGTCGPGCMVASACNFNWYATEEDGSCDYTSCLGCIYESACNYDPEATIDDGSCEFYCPGCTDSEACNYDSEAIQEDDSCIYNDECGVCGGSGTTCEDDCGVPNGDNSSCTGCMDETACNYDGTATIQSINYIADTLTTCGQEGRFGPTQEQINQAYGAESGITVVDGIQYWTVPAYMAKEQKW